MTCEQKIDEMGYRLPDPGPMAKFSLGVISGGTLFSAGAGSQIKGKLDADIGIDEGYRAAREAGLQLLSNIKYVIGDLDRVERVIKATCMVNSTERFTEQPAVANGFTDLMLACFGSERGKHARTAVGVASLPAGIAVEIEVVVQLRPDE